MPQLDFNTYASQLFWLFISFGMLFIVVSGVFLPLLTSLYNERANLVQSLENSILDLEGKIEHEWCFYNEKITKAHLKAETLMREALMLIERKKRGKLSDLEGAIKEIVLKSDSDVLQFRLDSEKDVKKLAVQISKLFFGNIGFPDAHKVNFSNFIE